MIELVTLAALLAGFYVAWNIGSNDTANAMGTAVGARVLSYRRAVTMVVLFVILGAVLQGRAVMETIGKGIVTPATWARAGDGAPEAAVAALVCAGLWVTIATTLKLPVSTSQSIVGAVMGAGIAITFMRPDVGAVVHYEKLGGIGICWVLTPIVAAALAFMLYHAFDRPLRRVKDVVTLNRIFTALIIITGCYSAYAIGANDVGNATGALYAITGGGEVAAGRVLLLFGGVALAVGSFTYSRRVMETVGSGITPLGPMTAFVALFGAALTVHFFTFMGIPVSTSQAIVGGVVGAGLVKGIAAVSRRKLGEIVGAWALTPTTTCFLSFCLASLLMWV